MPKKKESIYLETSVISAYFDFKKQDIARKKATRKFWKEVLPKYNAIISEVVFGELEGTPDKEQRIRFLRFIESLRRIKPTSAVAKLSNKYLAADLVPKAKIADATHLAIATISRIDYLVSWNQKHLTSPSQRKRIFVFNKRLKLYIPIIATPDDFFENI